ncbi:MAG TPA: hypothetical protein VK831_07680 [Candidatus Deferrimicrobiaceae bacterium]|nr:hypothetical protein [Candidatus Deferrimicrobiaceae bacterium]
MRRNLRALALTAVGGLLMLAPVSTALATSDVHILAIPGGAQTNSWSQVVRDRGVDKMTKVDGLDDFFEFEQGPIDDETQTIEGGSYDGKTIPG